MRSSPVYDQHNKLNNLYMNIVLHMSLWVSESSKIHLSKQTFL